MLTFMLWYRTWYVMCYLLRSSSYFVAAVFPHFKHKVRNITVITYHPSVRLFSWGEYVT